MHCILVVMYAIFYKKLTKNIIKKILPILYIKMVWKPNLADYGTYLARTRSPLVGVELTSVDGA